MRRHDLFINRLTELGMYEEGIYDGMIGEAVEELSKVFAEQGHSGMSAAIVLSIFFQLFEEYNDAESVMWEGHTPEPASAEPDTLDN
jgi:hypothetical protein